MAKPNQDQIWKVFVPYNLLTLPSGMLIGYAQEEAGLIYIAGVCCNSPVASQHLIGKWTAGHGNSVISESSHKNKNLFLSMFKSETGQISCHLIVKNHRVSNNCIIFSPDDFVKSYFIASKDETNDGCYDYKGGMFQTLLQSMECWEKESNATTSRRSIRPTFHYTKTLSWLIALFLPLNIVLNNRVVQRSSLLRRLVSMPSIGLQLSYRCSQNNDSAYLNLASNSNKLRYLNVCSRQLMDTCLGLLLMFLLMHSNTMLDTAAVIMSQAEHTADQLSRLLHWLMGAPAGLKLNTQLTEFLGQFFLYHIHLWKGYLLLIQPVLGSLLWYSLLIGVLGFTAQVCLLKDVLSMMTLHIYCFYVYAARLYRLQVYTLSALWRLFRGKKWNMLRRRVDSSSFDVDQLFIGTLLFTVLLFMLPTTTLYYIVFTLLRMAVLLVHGVLSAVVQVLNDAPVYSIVLWLIGSTQVAGDVLFYAISPNKGDNSNIFSMQICRSSVRKVLKLSNKLCSPKVRKPRYSWGNFFRNLVKGHLVYPWIDLQGERDTSQ